MNPLSSKINIPLLLIAIGLLGYFIITLKTILTGRAQFLGLIYPLYIRIEVFILSILGIIELFEARRKWERNRVTKGNFEGVKYGVR